MSNLRLIPYQPSDLSLLLKGFEVERGFLGMFPSLIPNGRIYGVVDAPPTVAVHPDSGYLGTVGSRDFIMSKIVESVINFNPEAALLVQDVWALERDYKSTLLADNDVVIIDGSVYIPLISPPLIKLVSNILTKIVSSMAVLIFTDIYHPASSTRTLTQHAFAVAVEAFDGQGWLLWVKKNAAGALPTEALTKHEE